jgi:SulP family sulfate permease
MPEGRTNLRRDVLAAITVALVGLPQCLAYALMAGLPPAYGLTTAVVPGFVAAIAGKNPRVVTGPTNTTGLLILAALGPYLGDNGLLPASSLGILATLTLMAGVVRLLAAYAGGPALLDFIPVSVLTGFTAGAGVLIAVMQLDEALGLEGVRGSTLIEQFQQVGEGIASGGVTWPAVVVTVATIAVVAVGQKWRPSFPAALVAIVAATGVAMALGLDRAAGLPVIADRAAVPSGWPPGALPSVDLTVIRQFIGPAAALAMLGTMELAVTTRRGDADPDMRRELVAQGLANAVGAFTSAFPASASLTRSALLDLGGATSRVAAALAALALVPILFFGAPVVSALPQASLAGILLVVATGMIKRDRIRRMWVASKMTRSLVIVTFVSTLVLPLEWAIFLGVGLGVGQHLVAGRHPRVKLLEPRDGRLVPIEPQEAGETVVLEVSGDIHFAAAPHMFSQAQAILPTTAKQVVVDLTHARSMRFGALEALERLAEHTKSVGGQIYLAGVGESFAQLIEDTGCDLPVTPYSEEPLASVFAALEAIHQLPTTDDEDASV